MAGPIETNEQIEEAASAWVARRESGNWHEHDQTALDAWIAASTTHRVAFLRFHAAWEKLGRLSSLGTPVEIKSRRSLRSPLYAVAAALLLSCTAGLLWYLNGVHGRSYESKIGAITNLTLSDGTAAVLDSNSKMIVSINAHESHVQPSAERST